MDALALRFDEEMLTKVRLARRSLEVGSSETCDLVVHGPGVAPRHLVVRRRGAKVEWIDLTESEPTIRALALGQRLSVGRHHSIERCEPTPIRPPTHSATEPLELLSDAASVRVVVGEGVDARTRMLREDPLVIGSSSATDLCLADKAVSRRHLRVEPIPGGVRLRDLGSRNGVWLGGMRVTDIVARPPFRVRVGRTDLRFGDVDARSELVAESVGMQRVLAEVARFARVGWPVLVLGESGAGKEAVAQGLHREGLRSTGPFVALNAGGLPRELIESELFGHEKGAFTGAVAVHRGVFEQAAGGTLFLDEIGELPLTMQARLLRVLDTGEFRRVGSERALHSDVRIVAATHRDLRTMVREGSFREDLYYRLAQLVVPVPPLRERAADIVPLALHFLGAAASELGQRALSDEATALLLSHPWPGNARELRNVVRTAAAMSPEATLRSEDIRVALDRVSGVVQETNEVALHEVLTRYKGNVSAAARALGMPRSTLRDRLRADE